jgi:type IV secretory pathway TraG/TraD family ATPase VirD4
LISYLVILTGESLLSRILHQRLRRDIFNTANESFPQEERRLFSANSLNFPYYYAFNGRRRKGWINVDAMRHLLVIGFSGAGKSWYIIQNSIRQQIAKHYALFIFDFKYDDLSLVAYNAWLRHRSEYPVPPKFYVISFDHLEYSHRCNPLHYAGMTDIADAGEAVRSFLLGLNMDWIDKAGDFWVESAVTFMTALTWYLRKYQNGKYCTLPHIMQLLQVDYDKLFSILQTEPQIRGYISAFVSAYKNDIMETLDNQLASLKISIARLSSPTLYYIMSGNDFTLDLNNPKAPKICCIGSSPQRSGIYSAVISLYANTINRLTNKKGKVRFSQIIDEAALFYVHRLSDTMATGRSNHISVTLALQDISQIRASYGRKQADVILNLPSNLIFGQCGGDSAKFVSDRIGKNVQSRGSLQTNSNETSFSQSEHLDTALPPAKISQLSAGEFVGVVADNPEEPVKYKAFHGKIIQDNKALDNAQAKYKPLPVVRKLAEGEVDASYQRIIREIDELVEDELERMENTSELKEFIIIKNI